jgi:DNA-directed RNA polymerase specialized sigma24 family protein
MMLNKPLLSFKEIAEILQVSETTVRRDYGHAIAKLRKELEELEELERTPRV